VVYKHSIAQGEANLIFLLLRPFSPVESYRPYVAPLGLEFFIVVKSVHGSAGEQQGVVTDHYNESSPSALEAKIHEISPTPPLNGLAPKAAPIVLDNGEDVLLFVEPSQGAIGGTAIHHDDLVGNLYAILADTLDCPLKEFPSVIRTQDKAELGIVAFFSHYFSRNPTK